MADISDFAEEAFSKFTDRITDEVFLLIEEDRDLMHKYLLLVQHHGLKVVNQQLGRAVKQRFDLRNDIDRQEAPRSILIQSHQKFL